MDNVVYILGAGFSAPLGLPVMSNFIEKAKDLYALDRKKYSHFDKVLTRIREKLAYVGHYYKTNLDNIEEVLSILVMEQMVGGGTKKEVEEYIRFLRDVIIYHTPIINELEEWKRISEGKHRHIDGGKVHGSDFLDQAFQDPTNKMRLYRRFLEGLFKSDIDAKGIEPNDKTRGTLRRFNEIEVVWENSSRDKNNYSVISFNYDLVLENIADQITKLTGKNVKFNRPGEATISDSPFLVKLHGSIDNNTIVPPTWNKSLVPEIEMEWKKGFELLAFANQIRIIGYSMPETDSYVHLFIKSRVY